MKSMAKTIFVCLSTVGLTSCYYDIQEELHPEFANQNCDTTLATYSVHIQTIMQSNCNPCHNSNTAPGGIITDNYQELKRIADNGTLVGSINHQTGYRAMPQNQPKLGICNIQLVEKWIREGSLDN